MIFVYSLPEHVEWLRSWLSCLDELCVVVGEHFPYGLKWNKNGPKLPLPTVEIRPIQSLQEGRTNTHERTSKKVTKCFYVAQTISFAT